MAFTLEIDGVERINEILWDTLAVSESMQARGQTMSVTLQVTSQEFAKPLAGQPIVFTRDGVREFAGRIATAEEVILGGPVELGYLLECSDWTVDLDNRLIQRNFDGQIAGDMIRSIIGDVGLGFTSNGVQDGVLLSGFQAEFDKPTDLISRIAEMVEHNWYVDYNKDVQFFLLLDRVAPISQIDLDSDTDTYFDDNISEQWDQVKNRIFLSGAKIRSSFQDTISVLGDGSFRFIPLAYEPFGPGDITVLVDAVPQNLLFDSVDGQAGDTEGEAGDVFICYSNWGVRFPDGHAPSIGEEIDIAYNYAQEVVVIVEDLASIEAMRIREGPPSDGVHELRYEIPDLRVESENAIWEYGQLLLARYASILDVMSFTTHVQGWRVGQSLKIVSAAGRRDLNQTMYVVAVQKRIWTQVNQSLLEYQITLSSSPFPG